MLTLNTFVTAFYPYSGHLLPCCMLYINYTQVLNDIEKPQHEHVLNIQNSGVPVATTAKFNTNTQR